MQSVRICGGAGHVHTTICNAQASAAAAVEHQQGGDPEPKPRRSPSLDVTTMPKPVLRSSIHLPFSMDPSKYQIAWLSRGSSDFGSMCQRKLPSRHGSLTGILSTNSPLVRNHLLLCSERRARQSVALGGGSGQPAGGCVTGQQKRCSRLPTAEKQSWHDESRMPQEGTAAFLTCGHWPPQMADLRSPRQRGDQ